MFVLQSKYSVMFQENGDLQDQVDDLKLQNRNLELKNQALSEQLDKALNNPDIEFKHMLLK